MLVLVGGTLCQVVRSGETPRLALEVRLGFIFLGRPLSKNILRSVLSVRQVLTRQSLLAASGELL